MSRSFSIVPFFILVTIGCKQNEIVTRRFPKEAVAAPVVSSSARSTSDITWKLPDNWSALPPSAMRVGNFRAVLSTERVADISVIALKGDAGGALANVNRWRGQLDLDPIDDATLKKDSEVFVISGQSYLIVSFASREPLIENKYKKRILAAFTMVDDTCWFFKATGDDKGVAGLKPAFIDFLKTVRYPANGQS